MTVGSDWDGLKILLPYLLVLFIAAEIWARFGKAGPEATRKLVHIGGGLACAFFPVLFSSWMTILFVTVGFALFLAVGSHTGLFKSLNRVERHTKGSEYFPLAVLATYVLAAERTWLYVASMFVLALADAAAALIGGRYGKIRYEVDAGSKSLEGSLAFFVLAFVAMAVPCAVGSDLPASICILGSLLVAVLVTGFEAISLRGSDNLFVPIGVCVILGKITTKPLSEVLFQLSSMLWLTTLVVLLVRKSRSFNTGGTITFALFLYGTWSLGSPYWALPILGAFVVYMLFWKWHPLAPVKSPIVFRALVIPLLLLVLANSTRKESQWYGPFLAACGTLTALTIWNHVLQASVLTRTQRILLVTPIVVLAWAVSAGIPWVVRAETPPATLLAAGVIVWCAAMVYDLCLGTNIRLGGENDWTPLSFLLTGAAAAVFLLIQQAGLIAPWTVF